MIVRMRVQWLEYRSFRPQATKISPKLRTRIGWLTRGLTFKCIHNIIVHGYRGAAFKCIHDIIVHGYRCAA